MLDIFRIIPGSLIGHVVASADKGLPVDVFMFALQLLVKRAGYRCRDEERVLL
jgi:hypothetical protein